MGPEVMRDYYGRFGLLEAAPIELRESAAPVPPRDWSDGTLASLSYGYAIMITPAQMAAATAAAPITAPVVWITEASAAAAAPYFELSSSKVYRLTVSFEFATAIFCSLGRCIGSERRTQ
jgi:hypothetical protein